MIRITSKVDGYRRCGILHPARPTEYPDDRFSDEELAVLQADPLLTVEVEKEPAGKVDPEDLEGLTTTQLKDMAKSMGLDIPEKATKKQLIELIREKKSVPTTDDEAAAEAAE